MTQLYTPQEVVDDFIQHEALQGADHEVPPFLATAKFLQLYSQVFPEPLPNGTVPNDTAVTERFMSYLEDKNVHVPLVDIEPDFGFEFNLYYTDINGASLRDHKDKAMIFQVKTNTREELEPHLFTKGQTIMLVSTTEAEA